LIAPCRCKGTQKYVHRSCLDNWRSTKVWILKRLFSTVHRLVDTQLSLAVLHEISHFLIISLVDSNHVCLLHITQEGFAFSHCTECRATFLLRANVPPDRWWLRLKFQLLVVRDHTLIFFIVQLVRCSHLL